VERLTSIPGLGKLTATTFVLTLGRAERFVHSRDVAGFLGLRPKQRQSGARDPQLGISKGRDPYLRKLLVQWRWGLGKAKPARKLRSGRLLR
jgi:transposase